MHKLAPPRPNPQSHPPCSPRQALPNNPFHSLIRHGHYRQHHKHAQHCWQGHRSDHAFCLSTCCDPSCLANPRSSIMSWNGLHVPSLHSITEQHTATLHVHKNKLSMAWLMHRASTPCNRNHSLVVQAARTAHAYKAALATTKPAAQKDRHKKHHKKQTCMHLTCPHPTLTPCKPKAVLTGSQNPAQYFSCLAHMQSDPYHHDAYKKPSLLPARIFWNVLSFV